ncbi:MAG: MarR family transcriptional regulator [Alphaproteobacteria bacterium]|nr:MarR family transcriptional regulator [Alphaproteobacteria bacterium]
MADKRTSNNGLRSAHSAASTSPVQKMGLVLDHIVAALGDDPSCPLRRAQILVDIDAHPGTTQTEVMDRLKVNKSTMNREIEWLYDHGCIIRQAGETDGRVIHIVTCGYSKKNLGLALDYANNSHQNLQNFIESLISIFTTAKPTLRDAKLLVVSSEIGKATRQELFGRSYKGPSTTNARTFDSLVEQGLLETEDS